MLEHLGGGSYQTPSPRADYRFCSFPDASQISQSHRQPVMDATRLEGRYDFAVDPRKYAGQGGPVDLQGMVITAVQEELGLKLESRKFEMQVIVIDHIEQPDAN